MSKRSSLGLRGAEAGYVVGYETGQRFLDDNLGRVSIVNKKADSVLHFGGCVIDPKPLTGLERFRFEAALIDEVERLQQRAAWPRNRILPADIEVDHARLLKLGLPHVVTDDLIELSTAPERVEMLRRLCQLNGHKRLIAFMDPNQVGTGHRLEGLASKATGAIAELEGRR